MRFRHIPPSAERCIADSASAESRSQGWYSGATAGSIALRNISLQPAEVDNPINAGEDMVVRNQVAQRAGKLQLHWPRARHPSIPPPQSAGTVANQDVNASSTNSALRHHSKIYKFLQFWRYFTKVLAFCLRSKGGATQNCTVSALLFWWRSKSSE